MTDKICLLLVKDNKIANTKLTYIAKSGISPIVNANRNRERP